MCETVILGSPTVNGFRIRQLESFCPVNNSWGFDNRTVGIRIIEGKDSKVRVEKRHAGADANPYLLLAGDIAVSLDGIECELKPTQPTMGNAYRQAYGDLIPTDPATAIELARASGWFKDVLGEDQWELYCQICERELGFFNKQVTPVELNRYLKTL